MKIWMEYRMKEQEERGTRPIPVVGCGSTGGCWLRIEFGNSEQVPRTGVGSICRVALDADTECEGCAFHGRALSLPLKPSHTRQPRTCLRRNVDVEDLIQNETNHRAYAGHRLRAHRAATLASLGPSSWTRGRFNGPVMQNRDGLEASPMPAERRQYNDGQPPSRA